MSTVRATNFQNAGSASVNMTLDTAGNATVANTLAMGSSFLRNRIINGNMMIDQRNAGASITPTNTQYVVDRWWAWLSQASKLTTQAGANAPNYPAGFATALGVTSSSAYSVLSSDYFALVQPIEGVNWYDLNWGTANAVSATLSFWVRSSLTGTFGGAVANSAQTRSYPFTYAINSADTWEYKTVTIPGDTSGTWVGATNGIGVRVQFGLGVGSSNAATAGSWYAANYISATGAVSVVGTNAATWYVTGVQLEAGSVATPFERRQYGQELSLCQRYFQIYSGYGCTGYAGAGQNIYVEFVNPVVMRATPTMALSNYLNSNAGNAAVNTINAARTRFVAAITALGIGYSVFDFTASAEL